MTMPSKYKVFIGSSLEHIKYAEAVQLSFDNDEIFDPVCWTQGVFSPSNYTLEDLMVQLGEASFGIFVLAPDDLVRIREKDYTTVRDNVIFEMGLFFGALGRKRTFFIVPKDTESPFRIPSDLTGLNYVSYAIGVSTKETDQHIRGACVRIIRKMEDEIRNSDIRPRDTIERYGLFTDFDKISKLLLKETTSLTTYFIHSRRWRETLMSDIREFLSRDETKWTIVLPDIGNLYLLEVIKKHFDDGSTMKAKVVDMYTFCLNLQREFPRKVTLFLCSYYPTYSFYQFDRKVIVSLYPLTPFRHATPTFLLDLDTGVNSFFLTDIEKIKECSRRIPENKLEGLIAQLNSN